MRVKVTVRQRQEPLVEGGALVDIGVGRELNSWDLGTKKPLVIIFRSSFDH